LGDLDGSIINWTPLERQYFKRGLSAEGMTGDVNRNWTYSEYLNLRELLELQGEERGISSDEMHFIIVHQTFELWFKQIIRELTEVRNILCQVPVPEDQIPVAVDHLGRTTEIFRLMANQWTVLETLTPQGFLAFRDGLGTASGFESYQMREFEILLGLENSDRFGGIDPLDSFRKMVDKGEAKREILERLENTESMPSLAESLMNWIARTPIMGSIYGSKGDDDVVSEYVERHLQAHGKMCDIPPHSSEKMKARMMSAHEGAVSFLKPGGEISRSRAGLLFIESYRELPLLTWPRKLVDAIVELEESMVKWRHSHARMVERIMGRRIGTGGTSGVDYLDATSRYRVFKDLWSVRTILVKPQSRPELRNADFYGYNSSN